MKAKLFSTLYVLGPELAWYQKPKFPDEVHYFAGLLSGQSVQFPSAQLCLVIREFCCPITQTNNGTCTYSECLGSKDTQCCLNVSLSWPQAHETLIFHWEYNLASCVISRAIFPLSLPDCSY